MYINGLDLRDTLEEELESALGSQELLYCILDALDTDTAIDLLAYVERVSGFERSKITSMYLNAHGLKG